MANFRIASTPRKFNKNTNEWEDGEGLFLSCAVWREYAENVAESLTKGMRVIVQGNLRAETYETREGERRTVNKIDVIEVGPLLRYATAKVTRTNHSGQGGGGQRGGQQGGYGDQGGGYGGGQGGPQRSRGPAQDDPWATGPQHGGQPDPWGAPPQAEEPPF